MARYLYFITGIALLVVGCTNQYESVSKDTRNVDLISIARENNFAVAPVSRNEKNHLRGIVPEGSVLRSIVILKKDDDLSADLDRVASAFWFRSPNADVLFKTLKSQVFDLLTDEVFDLVDETLRHEGYSEIEMLGFSDPGVFEDRIVFVRIRDELYEFHVGEGREEVVNGLILEIAYERG